MNVATEPRNEHRAASAALGAVVLDGFNLGTEQGSAARQPPRRAQRGQSGEGNVDPADLGCVDWYLYPVNRTPRSAHR